MQSHSRSKYFIVGEGDCDTNPSAGCPMHAAAAAPAAAHEATSPEPPFRFGRMFKKSANNYSPEEIKKVIDKLVELGNGMNRDVAQPALSNLDDTGIPAGYTYLGQFIAHEITFDKTLPTTIPAPGMPLPPNDRTPGMELDSLYGGGPATSPLLYEADGIRLKIGETDNGHQAGIPNDLRRDMDKQAVIADERNDENLAVAQTQVAFIRFHNNVVDVLKAEYPTEELFARAREEVVRHFQWIVLEDYLPKIVDNDVLDCVLRHGLRWFKVKRKEDLFMPVEFSAAAFRIGHSMVRLNYEWNGAHNSVFFPANLADLFAQTGKNGDLGGKSRLGNDWVIDWRRFFNFKDLSNIPPPPQDGFNMARAIDTNFDLHLDAQALAGFDHQGLEQERQALTVRNLLSGFRLGLPTGEEVAERIGETALTPEEIVGESPLKDLLGHPVFKGKTPLWYYVLREAELEAERNEGVSHLGPVGGRIIAETLIGIIRNSDFSVLANPEWRPRFGRPASDGVPTRFAMVDLLAFAGVVNPLG